MLPVCYLVRTLLETKRNVDYMKRRNEKVLSRGMRNKLNGP